MKQVKWFSVLFILVVVLFCLTDTQKDSRNSGTDKVNQPAGASHEEPASKIRDLPWLKNFQSRHQRYEERVLFRAVPSVDDFKRLHPILVSNIRLVMANYADLNDLTRKISFQYTGVDVGIAAQGRILQLVRLSGDPRHHLNIAMIPYDAAQGIANFHSQKNGIGVVALNWGGPLYEARLIHEIGHDLRVKENAASSSAPVDSDPWLDEELEMNALETLVLNRASNGRFGKLLETISSRLDGTVLKTKNWVQIWEVVTDADVSLFEELFGIQEHGPRMCSSYSAQFGIALSLYHLKKHGATQTELREFYLWQRTNK